MRGYAVLAMAASASVITCVSGVTSVSAQTDQIGQVVNYSSWGGIVRGSSLTEGATGLPVEMGDLIRTAGSKGKIELLFVDDTKFVVGSDSEVRIDEFVFNNQRTASSFVIEAAKGSFRFVTGNSPKTAYQVNTRSAVLAFRGTAVDFSVLEGGGTALAVYEGEAQLCGPGGRGCVEVSGPCGVGVTNFFSGARQVTSLEERNNILRENFPYIPEEQQQRLRRDFRLPTADCGDLGLGVPTTTGSLGPTGGVSAPAGGGSPSGGSGGGGGTAGDGGGTGGGVGSGGGGTGGGGDVGGGGNPGTGGDQGNAGSSPGNSGKDMGSGRGNSDNAPGRNRDG